MSETNKDAVSIAAKQSGLRPDQVERAVNLYRKAATDLMDEPDWKAVSHMSGPGFGAATYGAVGTKVTLLVESWEESRKEGGGWGEAWSFHYRGIAFERWCEHLGVERRLAPASQRHYQSAIRNFLAYLTDNVKFLNEVRRLFNVDQA